MKKSFLISIVLFYTSIFAVEGYKDIYIKSDKDIYVHTIYCAKDLSNMSALRPSVVYTNTKNIEDGTYYFSSGYGEYSATFKKIEGESASLRLRGVLTKGQTSKEQMKKEICLVEQNPQIPANINGRIVQDLIKTNDPLWNDKMKNLTNYFGKPAYKKDKYLSQK